MYNLELKPNGRAAWGAPSMLNDLDRFFDVISKTSDNFFSPACEILDRETNFTISLDVPGMNKDEINIEVKDNQLVVNGERKFQSKEDTVLKSERRYGKFSRVFTLPKNVKTEAIEASFSNGVLEITLPKEEKAQARKISISAVQDGHKTIESELKN
jgi:HSP20 family protein